MHGKITADILRKAFDTADAVLSTSERTDTRMVRIAPDNGNLTITSGLPFIGTVSRLEAEVEGNDSVVVPASPIAQTLRLINKTDELEFESHEKYFELRDDAISFRIRVPVASVDISEGDPMPDETITVSAKDFKELLSDLYIIAPKNNPRVNLNGIRIVVEDGTLTAVATDARILGKGTVEAEGTKTGAVTIQGFAEKAIRTLSDDGNLSVAFDNKFVWLSDRTTTLWMNAGEGNYPDWKRVIPQGYTNKAESGTKEVTKAVKASMSMAGLSKKVTISVTDNGLGFSGASGDESIARNVDGTVNGDEITMSFQGSLLVNTMKMLGKEGFTFSYKSDNAPGVFTNDKGLTIVLMPMR